MAIRKIVTLGGPKEGVLRTKAKKVSRFDEHLERLVADMWQTMREAPGVGLAAPQVGESIRVLVAEYEDNAVALVNPEIVKVSEEMALGTEGCLSIPGIVGDNVERHEAVIVKARNPKGKEIRVRAQGWFARVLQHEIDHLDGILFTDRIKPEDIREVTEEDIEASEGGAGRPAKAENNAGGTVDGKTSSSKKPATSTRAKSPMKSSAKTQVKSPAAKSPVKSNGKASGKTNDATPASTRTSGQNTVTTTATGTTQGGAQ
ncbi:MAG TPA: peptide deformylase [Ktedonobacterales bacterium]